MEIFNASDAKREFGEVLLKAQQAPIGINKNGKPVAVMISTSEYERYEALKRQHLTYELQRGMDSVKAGRTLDGKTAIEELKQKIGDASV